MSSDSRHEREQLKQQYKTHYRKMRQVRDRLKKTRHKRNIVKAIKDMDTEELMASFDSFLFDIKTKVAQAEARLDLALGDLENDSASTETGNDPDEAFSRTKARETLRQIKDEMGVLYSELEARAEAMDVQKTIGSAPHHSGKENPPENE